MPGGFTALLLLILSSAILGNFSNIHPKSFPRDVTYEELDASNLTCKSLDNCQTNRTDDLTLFNCHCGSICTLLDTCCVDSEFRSKEITPKRTDIKCLTLYGNRPVDVFMVDSCKPSWGIDDLTQGLCVGDGEVSSDPFLLVPVTSLLTGISYKNYFCAACNEDTELAPPVLWNLQLIGKSELLSKREAPLLVFNRTLQSWVVRDERNGPLTVTVSLEVPEKLTSLVKGCRSGVVSKCSDRWTDAGIEGKCLAYTALVGVNGRNASNVRYRNPHCAICNFETLDDFLCSERALHRAKPARLPDELFVGLFSFDEKTKRCRNNMVYDSLAKKCRVVRCGRGQVMMGGKCTSSTTT